MTDQQLPMFDGSGPELARDGIERVLAHQGQRWLSDTAASVIRFLESHPTYCADDLYRYNLMPYPPAHPNAIGALTRRLIEQGYLRATNSMLSKRTQAQARRVIVYSSTVYREASYDRAS